MNLLGNNLYDPASAVTKGAAASVMAAFDTTVGQSRIAFVVPPSGMVRVVIEVTLHGATTFSQFLLGVLEGSTLRGRVVPQMTINGTALATTMCRLRADYVVSGLTPGSSVNWDAAWGCETFVASSLLKYGGPNNTTANDAFGALVFQLWDPCPLYTPTSGTAPTSTAHVKLDTIDDFLDTEMSVVLAAVDTEVAAIKTKTDQLTFTIANKVDSSIQAAGDFAQGAADKVWSTAARSLTTFGTLAADVWAVATRVLTAGTNIVLAKGTGVTGFNDLSAAQVNAEADTAIADAALATAANLATVAGYLDTEIAAIKGVTDKVDTSLVLDGAVYQFTANALELAPTGGGGGGLTQADVRTAIGLGSANMDTQLAALQSDTNDIQARLPAALVSGRMDASVGAMAANVMTAAAAAADLTTELQSGLATAAALSTVGTAVDAVKLKTDNLPSDPADQSLIIAAAAAIQADIAGLTPPDNAGIAAIQAKTDLLTFTGANANVNVEAVNGLAVAGTGTEADPWVPA
jgi:hypothetical protein